MRNSAGSIEERWRWRPRRTSLAAALLLAGPAWALPEGGIGSSGSVVWQQTAPGQLQITQTTPRAAIDWARFSVAAGEQLRIAQPDAASILFNRVTGTDPSLILGRVQANGRVFLSNPRGVIFGAGSQVDVGGLLATTLRLDGQALANGRWRLTGDAGASAELRADGEIRAPGGTVALVAPSLHVSGNISAARIGLAAVQSVEVDVDGDGLIFFNARADDLDARLRLLPSAQLQAGSAELRARARAGFADTVLNLEGVVRARGLALRQGQVVVDGGGAGITRVAGELVAVGGDGPEGQRGGEITLLGQDLLVEATARLDASGALGGGVLRLGGDFQGRLAGLYPHARQLLVRPGAQLLADATQSGDGGLVVLWSAQATRFGGLASARGGPGGGDGGLVEVSSAGWLDFRGQVDLRATAAGGQRGLLLLDPKTLNIGATTDLNGDNTEGDDLASVTLGAGDQPGLDSKISAAKVSELLGTSSVSLAATDSLRVSTAISTTPSASPGAVPGSLSLAATGASGSISIERSITLLGAGSALSLSAATLSLGAAGQSLVLSAAGGLQLPASRTLNVVSGASVDIAAPLAGVALTKSGDGLLQLSAANTYSGGTTVLAGTLKAGVATAWTVASPGNPSVLASGPFGLGTVTVGGGASVDLAGLAVDNAWSLAGQGLANAGALHSSSGAASSAGAVTLASGADVGLGAASGASLALSGVIASDPGNAQRGLVKRGDGLLSLSGANTYRGETTVAAGTLAAAQSSSLDAQQQLQSGALGTGTVVLKAGSMLQLDAALLHNPLRLEGDARLSNAGAASLAGDIGEGIAPSRLSKLGAGALTLSGANTHAGGTAVEAGSLIAGRASSGAAGSLSAGPFGLGRVDVAHGASVDLAGFAVDNAWRLTGLGQANAGALHSSSGSGGASAGAVSLVPLTGPGGISEAALGAASAATLTLSGSLGDGGGADAMALVKLGGGSVVLAGAAAPGLGSRIAEGRLQVGAGGSTGTLAGDVLIEQGATLAFARSTALTVNGLVSGAGRLQQLGTAALTLTGANTHAGGTAVDAGSLVAGRASSGPAGALSAGPFGLGRVDVASGASVDLAGFVVDNAWRLAGMGLGGIGALHSSSGATGASAGAIELSGSAVIGVDPSATLSLSGAIADGAGGSAALTLRGGGLLQLGALAAPGAGTTLEAGTLQLRDGSGAPGTPGGDLQGAIHIDAGATLELLRSSDLSLAGALSGNGQLIQGGSGRLTLGHSLGFGGQLSQTAGGVLMSGANARLNLATLTLQGGEFDLGGNSLHQAATLQLQGGSLVHGELQAAAVQAQSGSVAAVLKGGFELVKTGSGLLTLSGANTYSGGSAVQGGMLRLGADSSGNPGALTRGPLGTGTVRISADAVVELDGHTVDNAWLLSGTAQLRNSLGQARSAGSLGLADAASLRVDDSDPVPDAQTGVRLTLSGALTASDGLRKLGQGRLVLTGEASVSGGTTVSAGVLQLGDGGALSGGMLNGDIANQGLVVFDRAADVVFAGQISGSGALQQSGSGMLTLTANHSHSGGTTVSAGMLRLGDGGSSGQLSSGIDLAAGTRLRIQRSDALQLSATIGGAGTVEQLGSGRLTLSGANHFSGGLQVLAGELVAGASSSGGAGQLQSGPFGTGLVQVASGAAVDLAGQQVDNAWRLAGSGVASSGALRNSLAGSSAGSQGAVLLDGAVSLGRAGGAQLALGGVIADAGAPGLLSVVGDGALRLAGANSFAGGLDIAAGQVQAGRASSGSAGALSASPLGLGQVVVHAGAAVDLAGFRVDNGWSLSGQGGDGLGALRSSSGAARSDGQVMLLDSVGLGAGAGASLRLGAALVDASAGGSQLSVLGPGELVLAADSGHRGGTRIVGGSLRLGVGGSSGSVIGDIANDGALVFQRSDNVVLGGLISGSGRVEQAGTGVLSFTADQLYSGGTTISAGTLRLGMGGASGSVVGNIDNAGALVFQRSDNLGYAGVISGSGRVEQAGTARLTFTANHSYSGGTTVSAGTLRLGNGGASGSVAGNIANAGVLVFQRSDDLGYAGVISGSGRVDKAGSGRLSFSADQTYTGGTRINAGTLRLGLGGTSGGVVGDIANEGVLVFQRSDDVVFGQQISGSGSVAQAGSGRLSFVTDQTYTGGTTVSAGTLRLGQGGAAGSVVGNIANAGTLVFQRSDDVVFSASISGSGRVEQAGSGRLSFNANQSYTGGTTVSAGTLRLGHGGTAGAVVGDVELGAAATLVFQRSDDLVFAGAITGSGALEQSGLGMLSLGGDQRVNGPTRIHSGTLRYIDGIGSATLQGDIANHGRLIVERSQDLTLTGDLSGSGSLHKAGSGTLGLAGTAVQGGGTTVAAGVLRLVDAPAGGGGGSVAGSLSLDSGAALVFQRSDAITHAGLITGAGRVEQAGSGRLTLTADQAYTGGTTISAGTLRLGNSGTAGGVIGDIANAGALVFQRSDDTVFGGQISGAGRVEQAGSGRLTFTADQAYTGGTVISAGTLRLGNGAATGGVLGDIANAGALVFEHASDRVFAGQISGIGRVEKAGSGRLSFTANHGYSGGTTVSAGILRLGTGGNSGGVVGDIANSGTVVFERSDDWAYGGVISGSGRVQQAGSGRLSFTADHSYTGGTTVSAGTLRLGQGGTAGSVIGDMTNAGTLVFERSDDQVFGATIHGSGRVEQAGSGRLTFTTDQAYTGGTVISAGTLRLGDGGVAGSVIGDIANAGALVFQRSDDGVFAGLISGSGRVEQAGGGQLSFTADHAYRGGTTVSAGSLALGTGGTQGSLSGAVQLAAGSLLRLRRSDALVLDGAITGAGGLVQEGSGSLTLSGANRFSGGLLIAAGRLVAGRDSRSGPGADLIDGPFGRGLVSVEAGAQVELDGHRVDNDWRLAGGQLSNSLGEASSAGLLDVQAATEVHVAAGSRLGLQGASQGMGELHKTGAGVLRLSGDSQRSGATLVEQGQLTLSGGTDRSGSGAVRVAAGATLDLSDGAELTRRLQLDGGSLVNGQGTARISGSGVLLGADSVIDRQGLGLTLAAPLDDGGSGAGLRLIGPGQLVLAANGSLRGSLSLEAGSLVLASASALSDSSLALATGTMLSLAADSRVAGLDGAGHVALGTHTLTLGDAADHRLMGNINGSGGLIKQGSGTLELAGTLAYAGPTHVAAGRLLLASGSTLAGGAVSLASDAPVQLLLRSDQNWASLNGGSSLATLQLLDGARLGIGSDGSDSQFAGVIVGDGGLSKLGAGTLSLSGSASHSGDTLIEQGRLLLQSASAGSALSAYRLNGTSTLQLLADNRLGALSGTAGSQVLLGGTLSLLGLAGDQVLASTLSGTGGLVKLGDNRLTLSGDNQHLGATAVLAGTLAIAADAALGLAPAQAMPGQLLLDGGSLQWLGAAGGRSSLAATRGMAIGPGGARLQLAQGHQLDLPATLSDRLPEGPAGVLVVAGPGTLRLAAANNRSGATRVESGASLVLAAEIGEAALGPAPLLASPQHLQLDGGTLRSEASLSLSANRGLSLGAAGGQLSVAAGSTLTLGAPLAETPALVALGALGGLDGPGSRSAADGLLHISGGGQVLLADGDSSRLGPTRVTGGSLLALRSDGALGQAPSQAQDAWLQLDGGGLRVLADMALAPSRGVSIGSGGALLDIAAGQRLTLAGALDDAAGLSAGASGTLTLRGGGLLWAEASMSSRRSGATEIRDGTAFSMLRDDQLGLPPAADGVGALRLDGGRLLWRDSATLAAGRGPAIGPSGATLDLADGVTLMLAGALSAWADATPDTTATTLAQAVLHKTGAGSLVLGGAAPPSPAASPATYTGHVTVSGGSLALGRDDQLGSLAGRDAATPAVLTLDGGTLRTANDLSLAATRQLQLGAAGGTLDVQAGTLRLDGDIVERDAAAARLVKTGAGSLALAGAAQHRGGTEVRAGLLQTLGAERLADAGHLQLAAGARLSLGGDETLAGLADGGAAAASSPDATPAQIDLAGHQLRLQQDVNSRYSGRWLAQDGAALVKDGTGTLDLAGALSAAARIDVLGGTLGVVGEQTLSGGMALSVARGATLRLDQAARVASLDLAGVLAGSGAGLQVEHAARLDSATLQLPLSAASLDSRGDVMARAPLRITGPTSLGAGRFTLAPGALLDAASLQISGGQLLAMDVLGGQLGPAMQVQLDAASLQLAGPERLASLQAGNGTRLLPAADAGSARLDLSGSLVLAGSELLLPLSAQDLLASGSQRLAAPLQLAGAATLREGRFMLAPGGRLSAPSLDLQAGLLLTHDAQALAGTGALVVAGGATLALGGADQVQTLDLSGRLRATTAAERESAREAGAGATAAATSDTTAAEAAPRLGASQSARLDGARLELALATPRLDSLGDTRLEAAVQVSELATLQSGRLSLGADASTIWLQTPRLQVQSGELLTLGSGQLRGAEGLNGPGPALSLAAGSRWLMGGDERLSRLDDGLAAAGAAGAAPLARIELGAATLTLDIAAAGAPGGDSHFSGVLAGSGSLVKQGAGLLRLTAAQAHGATRIEAGTLQLGAGGTAAGDDQARLGSGAVLNHATLRIARAGTLVLDQALSGSGSLVLDGPGTVQLAAAASHGGGTELRQGRLQTLAAERLPDAGAVQVSAGASLELGGDETLGRLSLAAGAPLSLGGSLIATQGDLLLGGPVHVAASGPILLSAVGHRIEALDDGNRWGTQPLSLHAAQLRLSAGEVDGVAQDLRLGSVVLGSPSSAPAASATMQASAVADTTGDGASDSLIQAGRLSWLASGLAAGSATPGLQLLGGTLALRALAPVRYAAMPPLDGGGVALDPLRGRVIQLAEDVITQQAGAPLITAVGSRLSLQAPGGGSITLADTGNRFEGPVQALSGAGFGSAWTAAELPGSREVGQSRITLAGEVIHIGGAGLEADMVRLATGRLATTEGSVIAARLWYNDSAQGLQNSAPGLQITLLPAAFGASQAFGSSDAPIHTNVGGRSLGQRSEGLGAGFVQLLPRNAASGTTVVFLAGPNQGEAGYGFFHDGAGNQGELPLFYNGVLPATPQLSGSLSAVAATSESARRERFEEVVRTENVAIRLRAGVIAEVGPGRAATQGSEGLKRAPSCEAAPMRLDCVAAAPAPAASSSATPAGAAAR